MTYPLEFDPATGTATIRVEGMHPMDEFFDHLPRTWSQPGYKSHPRLWDFRRADLAFSSEEMRRLADFVLRARGRDAHRTAFVVVSELQFGMARMFESLTHGAGVERGVFRDAAAGSAWLWEGTT